MKKTVNLSVKKETISKLQNFNFANVIGGAAPTIKFTMPAISKNTYTCSVCDNV